MSVAFAYHFFDREHQRIGSCFSETGGRDFPRDRDLLRKEALFALTLWANYHTESKRAGEVSVTEQMVKNVAFVEVDQSRFVAIKKIFDFACSNKEEFSAQINTLSEFFPEILLDEPVRKTRARPVPALRS